MHRKAKCFPELSSGKRREMLNSGLGSALHHHLRKILDPDEAGQELAHLKTQRKGTTVLPKQLPRPVVRKSKRSVHMPGTRTRPALWASTSATPNQVLEGIYCKRNCSGPSSNSLRLIPQGSPRPHTHSGRKQAAPAGVVGCSLHFRGAQ